MTDANPKLYTVVETFIEFLTVAIHQILKERKIYPPSIFILVRKYNLPVHQIRHPGLCAFLNSETAAIRQAILSKSVRRIFVAIFFQGLPREHFIFDTARMSRSEIAGITTVEGEFDFLPQVDAEEQMRAGISKLKDHCASLEPLNHQSTFRIAMEVDEDPAFHSYDKEQRNDISTAPTENKCCIEKHATQMVQIRSVKAGKLAFDLWYEPAKFPTYISSQPSPSGMACSSPSDMYGTSPTSTELDD